MTIGKIETRWDVIIVGGGITGAGIFREAAHMGLSVLLLEQRDFAWGTSSRSSKMVHGGLRYLIEGKLRLSLASVKERQRLLLEAPGLVDPLNFVTPVYGSHGPSKRVLGTALFLYSLMARNKQHTALSPEQTRERIPLIRTEDLEAGFCFRDAQADDARLVLRLIGEGRAKGGTALNYTKVCSIERAGRGRVAGVMAEDAETKESAELEATVVINATGAWAEGLHPSPVEGLHLRPLRGSHLVFPSSVIPITQAFSFIHPVDKRALFIIPWENVVLVGTTDIDHEDDISEEPCMTAEEGFYMIEALRFLFPSLNISANDCISSYAGIRPVLSKGKLEPSKESREHVVWVNKGLVTITGGKLTTFRRLAHDALNATKPFLPPVQFPEPDKEIFSKVPKDPPVEDYGLSKEMWRRLYGRYGLKAENLVKSAGTKDLECIPGTLTLWAEISYAARHERVRHLDDLLLRRVRVGMITAKGGKAHLKRIKKMCFPILQWNRKRWKIEIANYLDLCNRVYKLPSEMIQKLAIRPSRLFGKLIKARRN